MCSLFTYPLQYLPVYRPVYIVSCDKGCPVIKFSSEYTLFNCFVLNNNYILNCTRENQMSLVLHLMFIGSGLL